MDDLTPRQEQIMERVRADGFVAIDQLAEAFDVTPQTIRRDINQLCALGLLRRHHGGAGLPSSVENVAYRARKVMQLEAKRRIAKAMAAEIPDRASLVITLGTTNEEIAQALLRHEGLRIITNNLNVATILTNNPTFEIILAGGVVRPRDRGITGEATIDFMRQFRVDYGITGISGIDIDGTLLDFDYQEVRVVQTIMSQARHFWLAADHSKFGRSAMVELGHLRQVDALFTDRRPPEEWRAHLEEGGVRVVVADA
ncbi:DeoR/GlpR family DNA-binding transcription regulator [Alkalilimnicola ehrlichii]|uniref:DeoR family transcriptional regulator n=1 Tax=Alkalilimnicola ehrlichii TaxID=351052 RepID=A0A3E0WKX9_9GAMM|nr:DeoR family transcriptional regulator [Alkalilimnicola ehrlichii]RFA32636.1 DeoR family transcriptional regulator [Alkalilimnicola ehrlichii]